MPYVEHLRVDIGEYLGQVIVAKHMKAKVRRVGHVKVVANLSRENVRRLPSVFRRFPVLSRLQKHIRFGLQGCQQVLSLVVVLDGIGQSQPTHGILGIGDQTFVFRSDAQTGKPVRQRRTANEDRRIDSGLSEIPYRLYHHLRRLDQQARQANDVGVMFIAGGDQVLGRHLYA